MIHFKKKLIIVVTAIVALTFACTPRGEGTEGEQGAQSERAARPGTASNEEEAEQLFAVNTTIAREQSIVDYFDLSGDIRAQSNVTVVSEVAGDVTRIFVELGERVARNERIAEMDPSKPGQRFELNVVRSPIAGTVVQIPAEVGMSASPGMPLINISQTDELEIVTRIPERNVSRISIGQKARVQLDAYPDTNFIAEVFEINPVLDPITRTLEIRLVILDEFGVSIRPGMYAKIQLIVEEKEGVVLPFQAVVRRFGEQFVYIVNQDDTVTQQQIQAGIQIDDKIEVVSGVEKDAAVVYQGQSLLSDGVKVRVINELDLLQSTEGE